MTPHDEEHNLSELDLSELDGCSPTSDFHAGTQIGFFFAFSKPLETGKTCCKCFETDFLIA